MKRLETSSSSYYHNLLGNLALGHGESSKKAKKSAITGYKVEEQENGRCEICAEMTRNKVGRSSESEPQKGKEEEKQEVVVEEEKKENLEEKVEGNNNVVEVKVMEEKVGKESEVEEGKIVIIDDGVDVEVLLDEIENNAGGEGGEINGGGIADAGAVVVVEENNDEDLFSVDIIGEGDLLPGWDEWKSEADQNLDFSSYAYPLWLDTDKYSGINSLGVKVEPPANGNDWDESFWLL
ncbi:hypothetical protein RIF29_19447 [Crotalaria pallida]|uniref:Uncharacterized protein n=1 Tax=Crotalaria pallida TaxID=3830 RepID=A0AAN9EZH7_CROPI